MSKQIKLVVADDHELFRGGLKSLLRRQRDMRVVGEAASTAELKEVLKRNACDVLLLDLQMERWALEDIRELSILTRILVLTASESIENAVSAMRMGASAVVQKRFAVQTLIQAIHAVANGSVWMPPALQAELTAQWNSSPTKQLTARESEIIRHVAAGLRNAEIGKRLSITEATVKSHLNSIFDKLELRDRVELALYAVRHGLAVSMQPISSRNKSCE
jgi:DNA-binding NarL/FixJ family response regulator